MKKGKFEISLSVIAVIAFAFALLRQPTAVILVCGFAILAEKDRWLNRQAIQALLLTITYYLLVLVSNFVFGGVAKFFGWIDAYKAQNALVNVNSIVNDVIYIAFIVFCVIAIIRNLCGKDAGLPLLSKMSAGNIKTSKIQPTVKQFTQPQSAEPTYKSPAQSAAPDQTAPVKPSASKFCPSCGAHLTEDSTFCTECGAKIE